MSTHGCTGAQFDCCVLWPQLDDAKGAVKVLYHSQKEYERITGRLRMLREWKVCFDMLCFYMLPGACSSLSYCVAAGMLTFCRKLPIKWRSAPTRLLCHHTLVAASLAACAEALHSCKLTGGCAAGRVPRHGAGLAAGWGGEAVHSADAWLQVG